MKLKKNRNIEMKTVFIDQDYFRDVLDEVVECPFLHINLLSLMMNDFARIRNIKRKKLLMAVFLKPIRMFHFDERRRFEGRILSGTFWILEIFLRFELFEAILSLKEWLIASQQVM